MNVTIIRLALQALLGRRRFWLLLLMPLVMVALAVVVRALAGEGAGYEEILVGLGLGLVLPLVALLTTSSALGPEMDDGSIVYLLAKPVSRHAIAASKYAVALLATLGFGVLPLLVAGFVLDASRGGATVAWFVGGVLAARGTLGAEWVFVVTWSANVASALLVYAAGRRYGARFFQGRLGRRLLSPGQLEQVEGFFRRWGVPALILTRFLPGVRAVVPGFAGVSRLRPLVVVPTLAAASAVWYGTLTWAGTVAGANLPAGLDTLAGVNRGLLVLAVAVGGVLGWWWRRSRRRDRPEPR